jgi:hypothetical protein
LWKILVYGSYLDFNLIKKLKKYPSIYEYAIEKKYPIGMGVSASKGKYDFSHYLGKDFIDVSNDSCMDSFYIATTLPLWNIEKVHRQGENRLFNKYSVLIRRGVNTKNLKAKSAVLYKEAIFKHALSGINTNNIDEAKNFVGLINSNLFAYFNLETATSLGVEREQLHDEEKLRMPFINNQKIVSLVSNIEKLKLNILIQVVQIF